MFRYIAAFFIAVVSYQAHGLELYEWTLDFNTGSKHENPTYGANQYYNEDNDGFGITYGYSDNVDLKFGFFENSYYQETYYAGFVLNKDYYLFNDFVISPGVGFIFATGYDDTPMDAPGVAPVIHPSISFGHRTLRSTIGYLPYDDDAIFTFQTQLMF